MEERLVLRKKTVVVEMGSHGFFRAFYYYMRAHLLSVLELFLSSQLRARLSPYGPQAMYVVSPPTSHLSLFFVAVIHNGNQITSITPPTTRKMRGGGEEEEAFA